MDKIELVFQYTEQEYVRALRQYWALSPHSIRTNIILSGLFVLLTLALMLWADTPLSVVLFMVACVLFVVQWLIYWLVPKRNFRALAKLKEEYSLTFTPENIYWKTISVDSYLQWNLYTKCLETGEFLFLIQNRQVFTLIPKRAFADEAQLALFRDMCARAGLGR